MSGHLPPFQLDGELSMQLSRLGAPVSSKKGTLLFRRGDSPQWCLSADARRGQAQCRCGNS